MNKPNSTTAGGIVRWETLAGLPGDGPTAYYFHSGHPTPWKEGFVVRFWNQDGTGWVGNFQGLQNRGAKVVLWPEADSVIVVAMDAFYLLDAHNPDNYVTLGSVGPVDDVMLDGDHMHLFVSESEQIRGYGRDRRLLWTRSGLGGYDAQLKGCAEGVLTVEVEEELGAATRTLRLSTKDGTIL
jgi:hypothetical protein